MGVYLSKKIWHHTQNQYELSAKLAFRLVARRTTLWYRYCSQIRRQYIPTIKGIKPSALHREKPFFYQQRNGIFTSEVIRFGQME